ncbi:hypothetical protein BCR44DRAFT_1424127 [Catenaria anguillulae PL171]|uniref:Uncharacterized protein n=1 Tax=Catenaria anguillulae PL171 TaxID=765915 RepID=A0A1Y2I634_9FUNG|nr:hypothetical protein BCR44DRAFT_1424127 [Catenaria anguillulae PL171]
MAGSLANMSARFTSRQRASSQGSGQLYYPLSTSFVILSIANVVLWIIVIYGGTAGTWSGKLRNHALMNLVATWAVSVETSFEYLVRKVTRRQAAASQRSSEHGSTLGFGFTTNGGVSVSGTVGAMSGSGATCTS